MLSFISLRIVIDVSRYFQLKFEKNSSREVDRFRLKDKRRINSSFWGKP